MPRSGCCDHCETVAKLDERLDDINASLIEIKTDFGIVRRLVYGGVGLVLVAVVGAVAKAAVTSMGF